MAGIDESTKATGGELVKKNGKITGILVDGPMGMIEAIMPSSNRTTQIQALKDAENHRLDLLQTCRAVTFS